jgi:hypothetical protein
VTNWNDRAIACDSGTTVRVISGKVCGLSGRQGVGIQLLERMPRNSAALIDNEFYVEIRRNQSHF